MREVLLSGYGRGYPSEIVSKFEPKTLPRCRDSETRPLSLGEKWGTRRVDGVEGSTTLSDAVDAKPDSLVDFHTAWDLRREVQSIVKGQMFPHDISTRFR